MANFKLTKTVFDKATYDNVVNPSFQQVTPKVQKVDNFITVDEFFSYYTQLFYSIPPKGDINSHEYLIKQSGAYIQGASPNDELLLLTDEISSLRQELLQANQTILNLQLTATTSSLPSSTI